MADSPSGSSKAPVAVLEYEPSAFELTLLRHKTKLILVGVLAVVGTAGYWGYRLYKEASHKDAAVEFTRAQTVDELKQVAANHATQTAGGNATILAADYVSTERPKEAVDMLKQLQSASPDHPLAPLIAWRIAEYQSLAGDAAAAEQSYEAVAKAGTPFSAFALLRLGDARWAAGDSTKAQEYYNKILSTGAMSGSPVRAVATERVERDLKAKAPVLVDYKEDLLPPPSTGAPFGNINLDSGATPGSPNPSLLPGLDLPQIPASPEPVLPADPAPAAPPAGETTPPVAPSTPAADPATPAAPENAPEPATPPPAAPPAEEKPNP